MAVQHITTSGSTVYFSTGCNVISIRVVGMTTAGHQVEIVDPSNLHLWGTESAGPSYCEESILTRQWPNGFKVTTLDSGYVDVEANEGSPTIRVVI